MKIACFSALLLIMTSHIACVVETITLEDGYTKTYKNGYITYSNNLTADYYVNDNIVVFIVYKNVYPVEFETDEMSEEHIVVISYLEDRQVARIRHNIGEDIILVGNREFLLSNGRVFILNVNGDWGKQNQDSNEQYFEIYSSQMRTDESFEILDYRVFEANYNKMLSRTINSNIELRDYLKEAGDSGKIFDLNFENLGNSQ